MSTKATVTRSGPPPARANRRRTRGRRAIAGVAAAAYLVASAASATAVIGRPDLVGGSPAGAGITGYDIASAVYVEGPGITDTSGGKGRPQCTWIPGVFPGDNGGPSPSADPSGNPQAFVPGQPGQQAHEEVQGDKHVRLYGRDCGDGQVSWYWVPVVTAAELGAAAGEVVKQRVPAPKAVFSPDVSGGGSAVVHLPLWFAVPADQWGPVTATADVPGLTATAVARPVALTFQAGDGSAAVSCAGPGPRWRPGMKEPATPPSCSFTYRDASSVAPGGRAWPARVSIRWHITWTATNGQGGDLGEVTTGAGYRVQVREVQAIEGGDR